MNDEVTPQEINEDEPKKRVPLSSPLTSDEWVYIEQRLKEDIIRDVLAKWEQEQEDYIHRILYGDKNYKP